MIVDFSGGGQAHDNMQPSLALQAWIAVEGIDPSGDAQPASGGSPRFGVEGTVPLLGEIVYTSVRDELPPAGWEIADGRLLPIASHTTLFSLIGTAYGGDGDTTFALPDLRGRTALHAGSGPGLTPRVRGEQFGVEQVTLTESQLPSHTHGGVPTDDGQTDPAGGGQPHENVQPSGVVNYIIAHEGIYPSRDVTVASSPPDPRPAAGSGSEPYLGSITMTASAYAPDGWMFADGQLLSIAQHSALFSLLGTTFGGDGESTFALPDLRGRTAVHVGSGPGLDTIVEGEKSGQEQVSLTLSSMPGHTHLFADMPSPGDANGDGHVDGQDYLAWAANFGAHPGPDADVSDGDYNDDGWVDGLDYIIWASNFGAGPVRCNRRARANVADGVERRIDRARDRSSISEEVTHGCGHYRPPFR